MSFCVNTSSREFLDMAKRLNMSTASLENVIHEYMNAEGNGQFPSDSIVLEKLAPKPIEEATKKSYELWRRRYSKPILVNSYADAQTIIQEATKFFPKESVSVKETNSGKFEVSVAKFSTEALNKIASTPIRDEYKGKLIFAQSGTGKTSISDNINVIDSDYLLGQLLGVPTALAGSAFNLLGFSEKIEVGNKYRELIREKVSEGKTVVTANLNMLPEADVVIYNESAELSTERTSAADRGNRFANTAYQEESLARISEYLYNNPNKESHKLQREQFLGDVLLTDRNFNVFTERVNNNTLNELLNDFVNNFGISIEEYQGNMPLFNALDRVIKAKTAEDVPDAVGEAIAFMMQYNPDVKNFISERIVEDGVVSREELFDDKGNVKHKYNTSDFASTKARYFKEVGKEIATQLRRLYSESQTIHTEEIKDPLIKRIWNVISEFISKIFPRKAEIEVLSEAQQRINEYATRVARNVLANNEGLIIASLSKPEKSKDKAPELAVPVNVEEALANNPYERDILMRMSSEGIALAGSTSIAAFSRVLRPLENPLHDLDFQAPGRTKEELENLLKKHFGNYAETNTIADKETGQIGTRSYLILNRPFHFETSPLGQSFEIIVDNETGEHLGVLKGKTELTLNSGIEGKVLDFFVTEGQLAPMPYNFRGETFLMGDPKQALQAKISWMRLKDIFDYNRAVPYNFVPTELPNTLKGNAQFNISGKSLREYLRDKGLIHAYDPSMGDADTKAMYVTKGDGTYSIASKINQINTLLRMNAISPDVVSFSKTKRGNAVRIDFVGTRNDAIEKMTNKDLKQIKKVVDFLQARIPALKGRVNYVSIDRASEVLGRKLRNNENSFVKGGQIYLVGRRFTEDIAIEECLHPFTATLKYENAFLYNRLAEEAMNTFPKLWESIVANYTERDGFTAEDRINELVTQTLARNFREEFNSGERKTLGDYISQFISWFKRLFYRVNPVTGNQIVDLETISPTMSFRELAGLINTSDSEFAIGFEQKTRFNKERLQISPNEREFITETIVVPGMSSETLKTVGQIWDRALKMDETPVTLPYSEWKTLEVPVYSYENGLVRKDAVLNEDIINDSLSDLLDNIREEWYDRDAQLYAEQVRYNKADKTITIPSAALEIAKLINQFKPLEKEIVASLANYGYDTVKHMFNLVEAIDSLVSEGISFEELLTNIGGEFYYTDSRQLSLFDDAGNVTPEAISDSGLSTVKSQPVREDLRNFQEKTSAMNKELDNLLDSSLMSNSEVRHVAEQVVYFISDTISEYLEDPNKILDTFPELAAKDNKPFTEEERAAFIDRVKGMSRVELAKFLTPERLIEFAKYRLFTREGNTNISNRTLLKKAQLIKDNFGAIIRFANDAFAAVEDFSITSNGDTVTITEDVSPVADDFNNSNDTSAILENEGSLQEHWQIESRTLDVMSSMSQLVRQALNRCYQLTKGANGEITKVASEFGIAERVNAKDATASILRWTRGADSLSNMVSLLKEKAKENLWLQQIVDKLEDTTGKESDFQSQFFGVFAKAFQPYSVILKERNEKTGEYEYKSIQVNQHPALTDAFNGISVAFKTNTHPLFNGGQIRTDVLDTLKAVTSDLVEKANVALEENDRAEVVRLLSRAAAILGYNVEESDVNLALDGTETFQGMVNNLRNITNNLNNATNQKEYDPFKFRGENNIGNYLQNFLRPLTERLEETAVSSFYDSGKMYQSYVTPSYLTVLMNHFNSEDAKFQEFLETEYGQYEWFRNADGTWRNMWLETLDGMPQEKRKELFKHKVQLNFNKHNYMRSMSDTEYALSVLSEYFSEAGDVKGTTVPVWYRIPMMSNKPSSEFIRMYAYTGSYMKPKLIAGFSRIFQQELSRIQTVSIRDYSKKDANFIKNFDKNGKKFMMLDFFNKYLNGGRQANTELGRLLNKAIEEGTSYDSKSNKGLTAEENVRLEQLVSSEIEANMDARADRIIAEWKTNGIFEGAKQITNVGKDAAVVETKLREFIWNDAFAAMNILELTVTDPAYYKDAEDLQKRLAQIHAPGIRANVEAVDYNGNRVTDGKFRTVLLKDFDDFVSNIKSNLRIVFDRKLAELERAGVDKNSSRYKAAAATYNSIIDQFNYINVADAQGYSSPTSYRKKAFIFGKWSRSAEDIYQKLKSGNYNYSDLQTAFQPLKPFVYGQIEKPGIDVGRSNIATPLSKLKVPVQFKNSEYLLIMADAILQGEDTGMPNILRAIYEVMEESAEKFDGAGIDTIQFESTCKSGLMAPINIKQFYGMKGGETAAKLALEQAIYKEDGTYNTDTYVYEVPFENYAIQQDVPEHFKNHSQAHGSQIRYIIASDLENFDSEGNPVTYDYFDRGQKKQLTAEEFKKEYEDNISENIEESIRELSEQLGINNYFISRKDRNIALSQILLDEIFSSPRYGAELASACTVNEETGEFNIPLGDPIQAKRIEQLINSVVKNRINKQEVAGGPVVQVTNFGTSRELNIRFHDKNGGMLMTRAEWEAEKAKLPSEVYHYSDEAISAFTHKEDNYFSKVKGGSKNAIFFTDNAAPKEGTVLARNHKYAVKLSADKVKVVYGTKDDFHKRGSSYTQEVNTAEQEGYDAVRFIGLDDNQERGQNITVIFDPSKATILRDEGRVTSQESLEDTYENYVKNNQAGIAYYEVFAPIFSNELFEKFADKNGNIDIETIEMINPELLEMIGYRIPTEDKYSMAPLKIVGFLPREAGDGIMLPNDITLLTGSDFDVDKFYLMRKEINIAMRHLGQDAVTDMNFNEEAQEFTKNNRDQVRKYLKSHIPNGELYKQIQLTQEEEQSIIDSTNSSIERKKGYRIDAENTRHNNVIRDINEHAEQAKEALGENATEKELSQIDRSTQRAIEKENERHNSLVSRFNEVDEYSRQQRIDKVLDNAREKKLNGIINSFLESDIFSKKEDALTQQLKKLYIDYMFKSIEDTDGVTYRNNKIVSMSWAVLTNETTASKMLNPGGFEPQKSMGYLVSAYQNPANNFSWEELNDLADGKVGLLDGKIVPVNTEDAETGTDALKTLCYTEKNLCFIDTHLQFYKQNSAAATALGMAAVQKVAHAVLESNGYSVDIDSALNFLDGETFSIAGKEFSGLMEIDNKYNDEGQLIGRTLGEFVAMFADAVKDPVANLMNINNTTMPIVTTLIRFGMPFKTAALFISQPIIKDALSTYNSENVTGFTTLSEVINKKLEDIKKSYSLEEDSRINEFDSITESELVDSLNPRVRESAVEDTAVIDYKILKFFQYLDTLSKALKGPTYATRFNSMSNAVGPLVIDNLIMEYKATDGNFENFYDRNGNKADFFSILRDHPILGSFYKALGISNTLLDDMPANSSNFRDMLWRADDDIKRVLFSDRKTLGELSDYYQSYLLVASRAIPVDASAENKHQGLKYYIEQFPTDFVKGNAKELFRGNPLIDAIKVDVQKGRTILKVDTTGMTTQDKEKLGDGWADLYRSGDRGRKLAEHLFYYNFWRTGIGFSPKSFMGLFPTRLKSKVRGYNDAFTVHSDRYAANVDGGVVLDQFVRNNADNNKLAPKIKTGKDGATYKKEGSTYTFTETSFDLVRGKYYIRVKSGGADVLLKRVMENKDNKTAVYTELSLMGNNGEYFEASTSPNYTPMEQISQTKEQRNDGELQEVSAAEVNTAEVASVDNTTNQQLINRATKIKNKILELFMMSGRTLEQAQQKIAEFKAMSQADKNAFKKPMKDFFKKKLNAQGIEVNDSLLEEMYNELC